MNVSCRKFVRPMLLLSCCAALILGEQSARCAPQQRLKLSEVPYTRVSIRDAFWAPRQAANRAVSIPHGLDMIQKYGNLTNFSLAAQGAKQGYRGYFFYDSDVYKMLEAASYALATKPDPALEKRVDAVIAQVAAAQQADGYLDTYFQVVAPGQRLTNLRDMHEMYCAGHLFEAAAAHYQATGKRTLLNVATKYADFLTAHFGDGPGQHMGYPGHPEAELALVRLWRATGARRYLDLARFFVDHRGSGYFAREHGTPLDKYDGAYWLDDVPIREHKSIEGHAVRACYLMSGVVDVAREDDDAGLLKMVNRVWRSATERNLYVTGGVGPSAGNEGFTADYDLPNASAYQETCGAVALMLWSHRLNLLYGDARYADVMEQSLYNGLMAGISLDGKRFFYVNPLASEGRHHRVPWFDCACCPPNVMRTLASLGGYAYATSDAGLWVNLYVQGAVNISISGHKVTLDVTTSYPWDGRVKCVVKPDQPLRTALRLRIPGWCSGATARVNGATVAAPRIERGYLVLDRRWRPGDTVTLALPMPPRRIQADPRVKEDQGQVALARGPLVYCLEGCDNSVALASVSLPPEAVLTTAKTVGLPDGVVALRAEGLAPAYAYWPGGLYRTATPPRRVTLTAIPYYAWDNRAPGAMRVWMPTATPPPGPPPPPERTARASLSFVSANCDPEAMRAGAEPKSSGEPYQTLSHWWPHKGGEEWAQYTWAKPVKASGARVYWFDDTGRGECRVPASWKLLYRAGGEWKPVALTSPTADYPVHPDGWCDVHFAPVTTTAMRLLVEMKPGWAAGARAWKILEAEEEE